MLELHLDQEADLLLAHFAAQQGMSKAEVARRAVLQFLEDRELTILVVEIGHRREFYR